MNYFDNEENIIEHLQQTSHRDVLFVNRTLDVQKFFSSLHNPKSFTNWINSSGKDVQPPDFYSDKYKYMLEVMRIDDYIIGRNSPNALESLFISRVDEERRQNGLPTIQESNIKLLYIPDMSMASDNGCSIYIDNFKRIVQKHINKIKTYRKNHPGYKLGFLIFDESPGYLKVENKKIELKTGEPVNGYCHFYFRDKNLVEIFMNADIDFVIWATPYKNMACNPFIYPQVVVFDLKHRGKWKKKLITYNENELQCLEV